MSLSKRSRSLRSKTISNGNCNPARLRTHFRRLMTFETLETRLPFSADSIDGRPYIDLGPSDNVAWDQPRVTMQLIELANEEPIGPDIFSTYLLDTGANTILAFQSTVNDMNESPPPYRTEGQFEEIGVGGSSLYDISAAYQIDYAGSSGERNTIPNGRIISDDTRDLSIFGPWGITGMPAMTEKVTTLDFTTFKDPDVITMQADFSSSLPTYSGPRYSIPVDNRISFDPDGSVVSGSPPVWADLPFLTGQLKQNSLVATGDFLFDTGAQVSIMSTSMAAELGLDSNLDGVFDNKDASYARDETIGGIGGLVTVPVFLVDQLHVQTNQGVDLVWTDLQWLILDIIPEIDAIFGFDNMTSGWIESLTIDGQSGYVLQSQLDFRNWNATNRGNIHLDLNPDIVTVVDPNGPGAIVVESGGMSAVAEGGANDSYTIALSKPPAANVRVNLVPAINGQVTAFNALIPSNHFVDFTPANWNVPQTVVISAVNDSDAEGFQRSYIKNVPSSTDSQYQNVGMPRVIVNVIDNDAPGVMIIPSNGSTNVDEGGATDTYQIVLTYPPTQPVTIFLENNQNQVRARATNGGAAQIDFTTSNWNVPQSVTVTAVDDTINEGLHKSSISHIISTNDGDYIEFALALQETAFIRDNDQPDITGPSVTDVIVGSKKWTPAFVDVVDGGGAGSGNGLGLSLPGKDQLNNIAQNNIDKIYVKFSENVSASVAPAKFSLRGTNGGNYMPRATLAYGVDGANVLTISLSSPISKDALMFSIFDTLTDAAGNRLDGEWVDGVSTRSGNGANNGQFNFRIDLLPGDVDNSNSVTAKDLRLAQDKIGKTVRTTADMVYDVDGNGAMNNSDILLLNRLLGSILPSAPNAPFTNKSSTSNGGTKTPKVVTNQFITPAYISVEQGTLSDRHSQIQANGKRLSQLPRFIERVGMGLVDVAANENGIVPTLNPFQANLPVVLGSSEFETNRSLRLRKETQDASHTDASHTDEGYIDALMAMVEDASFLPLRDDALEMKLERSLGRSSRKIRNR